MKSRTLDVIKSRVKVIVPYVIKPHKARIKVNQNENPYELSADIKSQILERVKQKAWSRYPESTPVSTIEKLAHFTGWTSDGILIGNGSNELIQDVLTIVVERGKKVLIPQPSFTLYKLLASVLGGHIIEVLLNENLSFDLQEIQKAIQKSRPDVFIFCSPNNPTGCVLEEKELEKILQSFGGLVVVDEAYHEFSGRTALNLLAEYPNLVITRTFSNAMSLAGLRMGYLLAHPQIVEQVGKAKLPYNVNVFTLTAAEVVLENAHLLRQRIAEIIRERERLFQGLQAIPGVKPYRSQANFIVFETPKPPESLFNELLKKDILVRDVSYYPLLSKALRVSVGTAEENTAFIQALAEIFH